MRFDQVGVSILTNGARLGYLQTCIRSFLENCYYRPLTIAVFNNGSSPETHEWCVENLNGGYGINWVYDHSETDLGCAAGTNRASDLVRDCKYVLHLESDFEHIPEEISGHDKRWLHRALEFMEEGDCQYLYLRRMVNEVDIGQHWWSRWASRMGSPVCRDYMECPGFWWSNNPVLRLNEMVYEQGCLPLDESLDGPKGHDGWSQPELRAGQPVKTWVHKWGVFVHEAPACRSELSNKGCVPSGCKYGFFKNGEDLFCQACQYRLGYSDMDSHFKRYRGI